MPPPPPAAMISKSMLGYDEPYVAPQPAHMAHGSNGSHYAHALPAGYMRAPFKPGYTQAPLDMGSPISAPSPRSVLPDPMTSSTGSIGSMPMGEGARPPQQPPQTSSPPATGGRLKTPTPPGFGGAGGAGGAEIHHPFAARERSDSLASSVRGGSVGHHRASEDAGPQPSAGSAAAAPSAAKSMRIPPIGTRPGAGLQSPSAWGTSSPTLLSAPASGSPANGSFPLAAPSWSTSGSAGGLWGSSLFNPPSLPAAQASAGKSTAATTSGFASGVSADVWG